MKSSNTILGFLLAGMFVVAQSECANLNYECLAPHAVDKNLLDRMQAEAQRQQKARKGTRTAGVVEFAPSIASTADGGRGKISILSVLEARFYGRENISFVDLDTGTGEFVTEFKNLLLRSFKEVDGVGLDSMPWVVEEARSEGHNVVLLKDLDDIEGLEFSKHSKDIVTMNVGARHSALLPLVDRILKPNGLLVITFHAKDDEDIPTQDGEIWYTEMIEGLVAGIGYNFKLMPFPEDYPRSKFPEYAHVLIAWKKETFDVKQQPSGISVSLGALGLVEAQP